jgi:hypothetical protein
MQIAGSPQAGQPWWSRIGLLTLAGLAGTVLLALGAWSTGVFPRLAHPGSWTAWTPFVLPRGVGWVVWIAGLALLSAAWIGLHRLARTGSPRLTVGRVVAVAGAWIVPLLLAPPVGSRDVYSYAAHGQLQTLGLDPGLHAPWEIGLRSPFLQAVDPIWRGVVSAYGPGSTGLASLTVRAAGHDVTRTVLGLRLWMIVGVALLGLGVVLLARCSSANAVDALVLTVAGPLTIVHLVGGVHNEALMAGLMVLGLGVAAWRPGPGGTAAGTVLIALGATVKVPALLAVIYLGWRYDGRPVALWVRAIRTVALLALAFVTMEVLQVATGLSWGWVHGLSAGANVTTFISLSTTAGLLLRWLAVPFGVAKSTSLALVRNFVQAAGFAIAAVLLWRTPKLGLVGLGAALAVVAVTGVSVHPWYLVWALPVLAVVVAGTSAPWFVGAAIAIAASARPEGGGLLRNLGFYPWAFVLAGVAAVIAFLWWRRSRAPDAPVRALVGTSST